MDRIPSEFFKYTPNSSCHLLRMFFMICWTLEAIPRAWDIGIVCPLHKKDDPLCHDNYRSITVGNSIERIFSTCLYSHLLPTVDPQLHDTQYGFRSSRSTEDAIVLVNEAIQAAHKHNTPLYAVFVDFTKAFDTVNWRILFQKMHHHFHIPHKDIHMISLLYHHIHNYVRINGKFPPLLSKSFAVSAKATISLLYSLTCTSMTY